MILVLPVIYYSGIIFGDALAQKVTALYAQPIYFSSASSYPIEEDYDGYLYELHFNSNVWESDTWYFILDRTVTDPEMRRVIDELGADIDDEAHPLLPLENENGLIYIYDGEKIILYGHYTQTGMWIFYGGLLLLTAVCWVALFRFIGEIFNLMGKGDKRSIKREISAFMIFMLFGISFIFLKITGPSLGLSLIMDVFTDGIAFLIIAAYPVYLAFDFLVWGTKIIYRVIKKRRDPSL